MSKKIGDGQIPNATKTQKKESPNNSRKITEKTVLQRHFVFVSILAGFVTFVFLLSSLMVGLDIYKHKIEADQKIMQKKQIEQEIMFWQDITRRYKGFRDAYLKLAVLEYQLGNLDKARMYIDEALKIDPSSKEAQEFNNLLNR